MKVTSDSVFVITGAATGIGAELARTVVSRGARVAVGDVNVAGLETLAAELGPRCAYSRIDVSRPSDLRALADLARRRFGRIDVWVNNAAAGQVGNFLVGSSQSSLVPAPFGDDVFSITERLVNVNCASVAYGCRIAAEEFIKDKKAGVILTTASMGGFYPAALQPTYGATKAFTVAFIRALNPLLKQNNIRSTAICPGWLTGSVHGARDLQAYLSIYEESKKLGIPLPPNLPPTPDAFLATVKSTTAARVVEAMLAFVEDDGMEADTIAVVADEPFGTVESRHTIRPLKGGKL
ncbi:hypothetical protein DFJ74DRAFT_26306 [Hyaloraphidium curvatum]|nr:hypothetical protein DFJ74DRAFT_26306 [Hyaloraphidium curvatum]